MIEALKILTYILGGILTAYGLYQLTVVVISLFKKKRERAVATRDNKILCLIAARNEEGVIGQVINSLQKQNYDKNKYEIIVIPNNCQDRTAEVSLKMGASIYEPKQSVKNKGDALHETIEYCMKNKDFDGICIFDADNVVDVNFLKEMNKSLENGEQVVTGYRDSKNPYETSTSGRSSISFWVLSKFYNGSRQKLNLPCAITGTGFMVSRNAFEKLGGWNTETITEDNEFNVLCACNDIKVTYNENAKFYDEQPLISKESWKQRRRWTTGDWQVIGKYFKPLIKNAVKKRSVLAMDTLMQITKTVMQVLVIVNTILTMIVAGISGELYFMQLNIPTSIIVFLPLVIMILNTFIISTITAFSVISIENRKVFKMAKAAFSYWIYMVSYMVICLISLVKKQTKWHAITHKSTIVQK